MWANPADLPGLDRDEQESAIKKMKKPEVSASNFMGIKKQF